MKDNKNQITKACSFYMNDLHLTTMLLPFVNRVITDDEKVLTILESSIRKNIEELLSKMNLKHITQSKILEINWNSNETCKYSEIEKQIKTLAGDVQAINIIINGTQNYMKIAHKNIERLLNQISGKKVTIINCYELPKCKELDNILDENDFVLNTSGIKPIEEVFTNHKKNKFSNKEDKIV